MPINETTIEKRKLQLNPSSRDWNHDMRHESGHKVNRCVRCGNMFYGHKRRVICHECVNGKVVQNIGT